MANLTKAESEASKEEERSKASAADDPAIGPRTLLSAEKEGAPIRTAKGGDQWVPNVEKPHPARKLEMRSGGYGIAAGYEKPYKRPREEPKKRMDESYGPIPHSGYYGAGEALRPFKFGQAGFDKELDWYRNQYGKETSGYSKKK